MPLWKYKEYALSNGHNVLHCLGPREVALKSHLLPLLFSLLIVSGTGGLALGQNHAAQPPLSKAKKSIVAKPTAAQSADVALLARGTKLHRDGQVDEAETIFKQVLAHDPRNVDAFYDLGAIAESRGDLIGALSNYHAALSLRPGDRELKDAVYSTEKALRKNALTIKQDNSVKQETPIKPPPKISPVGIMPNPSEKQHVSPSDVQALSDELAKAQAECRKIEPEPVISLPQTDSTPIAVDGKTFSLSSRKSAMVPPTVGVPLDESSVPVPTLGITPEQFPDVPLTGSAKSTCPPPPTLNVGTNQSNGGGKMRRAASIFLTVGAGAALNMSGLHCPICHMMNGHF